MIVDTTGAADTLELSGFSEDEVTFDRRGIAGEDLIVRLPGGAQVTVIGALADGVSALAQVVLTDDGTTWPMAQITSRLIAAQATEADNIVLGTDGADDLTGGAGADLVSGGEGNDTYRFAAGDGDDRFIDEGRDSGDTLVLDGLNTGDLAYALRAGPLRDDLVLVFQGGRDRIVIENALEPAVSWNAGTGVEGVDRIVFGDGTEWDRAEMRVQALDFAQGAGSEIVWGFYGDDVFTGSAGNDTIIGSSGNDLYVFRKGFGHDRIEDLDTYRASEVDVLDLQDFVSSEVAVARLFKGSDSVILTFASTPDDSLTIVDALAQTTAAIEEYRFSDGQIWDRATLLTLLDNNAPVAGNDGYYSVTEGEQIVLTPETLLRNDFDADNDTVTIIAVDGGADGFAELDAQGRVVFTPVEGFAGATQFSYTISDGRNGQATASVDLRVRPVAEARDDSGFTLAEDGWISIPAARLLSNDIDGDRLQIGQVGNEIGGTANLNSAGEITFTPFANYNGEASFTYTATTPENGVAEARVSLTVTAVNDAPVARADTGFETFEDRDFLIPTFRLLQNDFDVDGDALTLQSVQSSADLVVALTDDGYVQVTPRPYFFGNASFSYTVVDAQGAEASNTVSVWVEPVNNAPQPQTDVYTSDEDQPLIINYADLIANDFDPDGDPLTVIDVRRSFGGRVTELDNGTARFDPSADFFGEARLIYTVGDGQGGQTQGQITINVTSVNDRPEARNDHYSDLPYLNGTEDEPLIISLISLMQNDTDVEGLGLTFQALSDPADGVIEQIDETTLRFTPDADFWGVASFSYSVSDPDGAVDDARVTMFFENVDDAPPEAFDDVIILYEDTQIVIPAAFLLSNDTDIDRDPLTLTTARLPNTFEEIYLGDFTGAIERLENGDFLYTAGLNETEESGFFYTVTDGILGSDEGFVDIQIIAVNDQPTAVDDTAATTGLNIPLVIRISSILANDFDVDGEDVFFVGVDAVSVGVAEVRDGFVVVRVPEGYTGPISMDYRIRDAEGLEDVAQIEGVVGGGYSLILNGTAQPDLILGSDRGETVFAGEGNDSIETAGGDDLIVGDAGQDRIDGGAGFDTVSYENSNGRVRADLVTRLVQGGDGEGDVLDNIEALTGSIRNDELYGDARANRLDGGAGDDELSGREGVDTLLGGAGDDALAGGADGDLIDGGAGRDTADYAASQAAVTVSLADGTATGGDATGDTLTAIEDLTGSEFDDVLTGDAGDNTLIGRRGADTLDGGAGDDVLIGGRGADVMRGGAGIDIASYTLSTEGVLVDMASGESGGGGATGDTFESIEIVRGSFHDDTIRGNDADNILRGSGGADLLDGRAGYDIADYSDAETAISLDLTAGTGGAGDAAGDTLVAIEEIRGSVYDDTILGSDAGEVIDGNWGDDTITGGGGSDGYRFGYDSGHDVVIESGTGGEVDQVLLGTGIAPKDLSVVREGDDMLLELERDDGFLIDTLRVVNHFASGIEGIEEVVFDDGTVWDRAQLDLLQRLGRFNAVDDIYRFGVEDETALIDPASLIANDSDSSDYNITLIAVGEAVNGTVRLTEEGMIAFDGDENFNGDAFFTYTVRDDFGRESSARVEVNLRPVNDAPEGTDDGPFDAIEDTVWRISLADLLANDTDIDGDPLTIVDVFPLFDLEGNKIDPLPGGLANLPYIAEASNARAWLNNGEALQNFDPYSQFIELEFRADHVGPAGFTYVLADPDGLTSAAQVLINVSPVNDAPRSARDDRTIRLGLDEIVTVAELMANDYDIEGDTFEFVGLAGARNGAVTLDADTGIITFTPDALGAASFDYELVDARGAVGVITVDLDVIPINDAPIARDDGGFVTLENAPLLIDPADLLANDTDDTDPLDDVIVLSALDRFAENGRVELDGDGMILFTPRTDYNGEATFLYEITDGNGGFDTATVTVQILPANRAPEVRDDLGFGLEDEIITIIPGEIFGNDLDADGDVLFLSAVDVLGYVTNDLTDRDPFEAGFGVDTGAFAQASITATLDDGAPLPEGLEFDAQTLTLSGARADGQNGALDVMLTFASGETLYSHTTTLPAETDIANGVNLTPPLMVFDAEGGAFSVVADNGRRLPLWLEFDADTLALTQTDAAPVDATDPIRLELRYSPQELDPGEDARNFGRDGFAIEVWIDPQAPDLAAINALFANDPFFAAQGLYALELPQTPLSATRESGADLPEWLSFHAESLTFAGTPPETFVGTPAVRLAATPATGPAFAVLTELAVDDVVRFTDEGAPTELTISDDRFSLITPDDFYGHVVVQYSAEDDKGAVSDDALIVVEVRNTPEAPEAQNETFTMLEDGQLTVAIADLLANATDAEGDPIRLVSIRHGGQIEMTRGTLSLIDAVDPVSVDSGTPDLIAAGYTPDAQTAASDWAYNGIDTGGEISVAMVQDFLTHDRNDFCGCSTCQDRIEELRGALELADLQGQGNFADLAALAEFVEDTYWGADDRYYNVTDTGGNAKSGVITYTLNGTEIDPDGLTADRAELVREVFKLYEATMGLEFRETQDALTADITFSDNDPGRAYASSVVGAGGRIVSSHINVDADWNGGGSGYNDYTVQTMFHEVGHTLGLGHQGAYNGAAVFGIDQTFQNDSWQATMMSYFSQSWNFNVAADFALLQTPMVVDWLALDTIYGAQGYGTANAFTDDTVWGFNTTITSDVSDIWATWSDWADTTASTLVDGAGHDTLDLSGFDNNSRIDLRASDPAAIAPSFSNIGGLFGNLSIAAGTVIEDAVGGAGHEVFFGNAADNTLIGGAGQDTFHDSTGADSYIGGLGTDMVIFADSIAGYTFELFEGGLQVIGEAIDWVADTVDFLSFADRTLGWGALVAEFLPDATVTPTQEARSSVPATTGVFADALPALENAVYTAQLADGSALPFWIRIDRDTGELIGEVPFNVHTQLEIEVTLSDGVQSHTQTIAVEADGNEGAQIIYTPRPGANGTFSYAYAVTDDAQGFDMAEFIVEVAAVNDPPEPGVDRFDVLEDSTLMLSPEDLLANDADVDGDTLSVLSVGNAVNGTVEMLAGVIRFTPTPNYDGPASFTYVVTDGTDGAAMGQVNLRVISTNSAPVAAEDRFTAPEDTPITFTVADLLANDGDPDGDAFSFDSFLPGAENGTLFTLPDGRYQFVADPDFNGEATLRYRVTDGRDSAVGTVVFDMTPVNDAPILNPDPVINSTEDAVITVDMATIIGNDVDVEGDAFSVVSVTDPENGSVTLDGTIARFTPRADYFGNAGFHYVVEDARGASVEGFVSIRLNPENDRPLAVFDTLPAILEDTVIVIDPADLLANDSDPDGHPLTLTGLWETQVIDVIGENLYFRGDEITPEADGTYRFAPPADAFGTFHFEYEVSDGIGLPVMARATLEVLPVADDPRPGNDNINGVEDTPITLLIPDLLANDNDPDGSGLLFTGISAEDGLSVVDDGEGRLIITPDADRDGVTGFNYTVLNGLGAEATARVTIYLVPVNDAPIVPELTLTGQEDAAFSAALNPGDFSDPEGDTVSVSLRTQNGGDLPGWLNFDADTLTVSGQPPADFSGDIVLELVATDGVAENVSPLTLTFAAVNDAPVIAPFSLQGGVEDTAYATTLDAALFTDADGDTLVVDVRGPNGAALPAWLAFDAQALTLTGQPPTDFNGDVALEIVASDGAVQTVRPLVLSVAAVNDAPRAQDDTVDAGTQTVFTIAAADLLANDSDPEGDPMSIVGATGAAGVAVEVTEDGDIVISRDAQLAGRVTLSYTVSDGTLQDTAALHLDLTLPNLAPEIDAIGPLTGREDTAIDLTLPAGAIRDPNGDALTLTVTRAGGIALPDWLSFDAATRGLSGQPPADFNGRVALELTASDGQFQTTRDFDLVIDPVNDIPVLRAPLSDRSATEDTTFSIILQQGIYDDVDGDTLSFALTRADGSALPDWIAFDPQSLTLSGTPPQDYFGDIALRLAISDGVETISDDFTLTVLGRQDAPVVANPLGDVTLDDTGAALTSGTGFSVTLPADVFTDADGDTLSLAATLVDGSPLPAWLSFDGVSFTGTAPAAAVGRVDLRLTATDGTDFATEDFSLVIEEGVAPTVLAANDSFATDVTEPLELSQADLLANDSGPDGTALEVIGVTATGTGAVSLDQDGAIRYVAAFDQQGLDQFTYTVTDGTATAQATVSVDVRNTYETVSEGDDGSDALFGGSGDNLLAGGGGSDNLFAGGGNDALFGGAGRDNLFGGRGNDLLDGGSGADHLFASGGNDTLRGGAGNDLIFAGGGDDDITGGTGNDLLFAGSGDDTFRFGTGDGQDVIYGFQPARSRSGAPIAGDTLAISVDGIEDFAALMAQAQQTWSGVLLDLGGGDEIFLAGTRLAALDQDQFTFY
ncbi:tandem-95 repeat protein [Sulfitobacter albidus]|uniref:Tandem-95 repeat protein n=1 Tax=Sulfitobacter albidus TaxID=2829501 RepID=A0A975JFD5_9RHOB|nr:tandem-95 repeat protein [Sulfitobacter albidus]QUJ77245.1 tandem-95 repeat protein [Sulfitobacter albidus]